MAGVEVATGLVATDAADETDFSVSGLSFQPKALLLLASGHTSVGNKASYGLSIGIATGAAAEFSLLGASVDAAATSDGHEDRLNSRVINCQNNAGTILTRCEFKSFQSDGFTLTTKSVDGSAYQVAYIALGGADLTNVLAGEFAAKGSAGSQSITGVGFQPDCIIFVGHGSAAASGGDRDATFSLGAAIDSSNEFAVSGTTQDAQSTSNTRKRLRTDRCIYAVWGDATVRQDADFTSMDADGFTLNWNTSGNVRNQFFLALKGGSYEIFSDTQKTSTGTKETSIGIDPNGILLASCQTTDENETADHHLCIGAGTSSTSRWSYWHGDSDAQSTTVVDAALESDTILAYQTEGTPTLLAEADIDSLADGSVTLDWSTADATARKFVGLALGDASGATSSNLLTLGVGS